MIEIPFAHRQSSHCESGVTANLLCHQGHVISESVAFGVGTGLFFAYLPFVKVNKLPLTTYRCEVGGIFKRVTRRLGCTVNWRKFRSPHKAMDALDETLSKGIPVGCRTGGYWLPYFPPAFRFHFNMHNLVVFGKEGDDYLISDPVFPHPVRCPRKDLMKARFAKGALAPRGAMYHLAQVPGMSNMAAAVTKGIREVCRRMLKTPLPVAGIRGIRLLADRIGGWPSKLGPDTAVLHVGQLIRMQEEIGTGGGGFRFMYAAFLQEAAGILNDSRLLTLSEQMTAAGDMWRKVAVIGARICKGRASDQDTYDAMAELLKACASGEKQIYKELMEIV